MIKLLIISYDFPPVGGIGIQRVTKWIKYFPKYGIEPVVLTNEHGLGYIQDDSLLQLDFIKKTKIYRLGGGKLKKYHLLKKNGKLHSIHNYFLILRYIWGMDIFSSWYREIKNEIISIVEQEKIDCILTTSPPHSTHLFGSHLKIKYGIPWIMDIRDSMTNRPDRTGTIIEKLQGVLEAKFEKIFYINSDSVIFATELMKENASKRCKELALPKTYAIRNGYDADDYLNTETLPLNHDRKFCITYTGTMRTFQNPQPFCNSIISLVQKGLLIASDIMICLVGEIYTDKQEIFVNLPKGIQVEFKGVVTHRDSIKYQLSADLLLLLMTADFRGTGKEVLTGKVFEYIGAGKPILALVTDGELADLIQENKFGYVADPGNQNEVEATLLTAYQNWKQGINIVSGENRKQFTRESQCETLSHIIHEVVKQHKAQISR